jgi:hypothetical protein
MPANKQSLVAEYQAIIAGLQKHNPNLTILIASQTYTSAQLVQALQTLISSGNAVLTARTAAHDAVVADAKVEAQYAPLIRELKQSIALMYSNAATTLADFGITPRKPRKPLSTEALAARAAKAKATRVARGTTSKKQKATVTGNVTGVNIVPVTGSASSAAPPAPATAPASPTVTPSPSGAAASAAAPHA